jgi:hypothetical protein
MREALAAEDDLCLCLSRGQLSPEVRNRAQALLGTPLRWDRLLQRAYEHQVYPLVHRSLRILEFYGVPPGARAKRTAAFRANTLRNAFLRRELVRVLRLLGAAGVPVIPLKGVTLAESLFGDTAYRVCSDIDIFVPAGETLRARRLLLAEGHTSPFSEEFFLNHQFHTSADCSLLPKSSPHFSLRN